MKKVLIAVVLIVAMSGCTAENEARRVLENDGFTNIQLKGWSPFSCDQKDTFATGFEADKNGRHVKGVVCSGVLKGATIRFN
jgi:uncharacterized lipoprotein YehR (DUF1307 family)